MKRKPDLIQRFFEMASFHMEFTKQHPECKNCQHIDIVAWDSYPITKETECINCPKYKGW